ncbi:NAD(P)/FAD-dependent oxidoreductase [Rhodococcus qingshengii]|uniref:NAD(P)/FAD-dependent oxidoreductase n=1 Tax=Rhodococcus qingshengii TaxID=334542 RepID=UPI001BE9D9CF|nr:FAD-dependent oxidoreductase [Rhodococcus qingshengii]MBT2276236.1 FAD-dependent oxidoreductase [Rhodococcus qingshengii]
MSATVIIGAGMAGVQTGLELRHRGYIGDVVLIGDEADEPYDRPPLSKDYLKGAVERKSLGILPAQVAAQRSISLKLGQRVTEIRPRQQHVVLEDRTAIEYENLVIATGAHNRTLPVPGADLPGVRYLRRLGEADSLREALHSAKRVAVVGAGFIGLEVAAAASASGAHVTVIESMCRVMARALSPAMSRYFLDEHARHGVRILTEVGVTELTQGGDGRSLVVHLSDGSKVEADIVVVGVGVSPATELAEAAGVETTDGVVVDGTLRTSDPHIYALGDCVRFDCVVTGREVRLESIQNAADQARFLAAHLTARERGNVDSLSATYSALPWFWTEQYGVKLQIAGVASGNAESVVRGDPETGKFSIGRFDGDVLQAVESVNHVKDHLGARKLLAVQPERRTHVTRTAFGDASIPLASLVQQP